MGILYVRNKNGTPISIPAIRGERGDKGEKGDKGLNWCGSWREQSYYKDDVVTYNGSTYICIDNGPIPENIEPGTDETTWVLLAAKGEQGPEGEKGDTGPAGASGATTAQVIAALTKETWIFTLVDGSTVEKVVPLI